MKTFLSLCFFLCVLFECRAQISGIDSFYTTTADYSLTVNGSSDTVQQLLALYHVVPRTDTSITVEWAPSFLFNNQTVIPYDDQAWLHISNDCPTCQEFMAFRLGEVGVSGNDLIYAASQSITFQTGPGSSPYRYWITAGFPCWLALQTEGSVQLKLFETTQSNQMISDTVHYFYHDCSTTDILTLKDCGPLCYIVGNQLKIIPGATCIVYDIDGRLIARYKNTEMIPIPVGRFIVAQIIKDNMIEIKKIFIY